MIIDQIHESRFTRKTDKRRQDQCWPWLGSKNYFGYGWFRLNGKTTKAHRVAWLLWRGKIPDGMCVLHECDNPSCVNPKHLWIGTKGDNNRDKALKGRAPALPRQHYVDIQKLSVKSRMENAVEGKR